MTIQAQIDSDCKSIKNYFNKLFEVFSEAKAEEKRNKFEVLDIEAKESLASYHRISHLIKPDMIINIYSLLDYWMNRIGEICQKEKQLQDSYRNIKGKHNLQRFHRYIRDYIKLDLKSVQNNYQHLNELRIIRNIFVHHGGHVSDDKIKKVSRINGVELQMGSLIIIKKNFIWEMIDHTKIYLQAVSNP